ncbi:ABC transporter substrate-binding protein [Blastococcus sp. TML/C7B]|nr:ABC transporter substrate-binding protein [Blastococcus sp. TML/C7B]
MRGQRRPTGLPWKRALASLGLVGILLGTAACGGDDGGDDNGSGGAGPGEISEQGDPVSGGEITVGLEAETNSWLPGEYAGGNSGTTVAYALYDPLMKRTAEGEFKPFLAESMEPNEDFTTWTLTLRPDVQFHDGTPLNGEALKTVFDTYLKAPTSNVANTLAEVSALNVVDDLTVEYVLTETNAAFPDVLTGSPGWPFSPTAAAAAGEDAGANPVGTGPFSFVSWQRDSNLVLEKNENYWQDRLPISTASRSGPSRTRTPAWPACRAVTSTSCRPCGRAPSRRRARSTAWTTTSTSATTAACRSSTPPSHRSTTCGCGRRWRTASTSRR